MSAVRIQGVARTFGAVHAVDNVSLDIGAGEFFTLLGPSGCGKTTLLRMVAGFCDLDQGAIYFGERRVDNVSPHRRNAGMVFQNYAIFPNLTVAGNVAYGLKARRVPPAQIGPRIERALRLVHLDKFAERWPHEMSGGQLQRVALARCLVIEPDVLLLDEPLSNLDAQLRIEMRREIRQLQQALKITTIYVTHDQEEALAVSDRIAVMSSGRLEQVATPAETDRHPATPFVAEFVGATNLLTGNVLTSTTTGTEVMVGTSSFRVPASAANVGQTLSFSLRPETIRLLADRGLAPDGWATVPADLAHVEFLGPLTRLDLVLADGATKLRVATLDLLPIGLVAGQAVRLTYDPARVTLFL